jgi:general secretion pathway protein K
MTQRGFALLAVLWVVTAVTVLAGSVVTVAQLGSATTRNRVLLTRAGWAREACVEILLARYAQNPSVRRLDRVDFGRGTWCAVSVDDPSAKLNMNLADRTALVSVLQTLVRRRSAVDSLADALLDWRDPDTVPRPFGEESAANRNGPLADVAELHYVRGFSDSLVARLSGLLTTRGTGAINVNAAPRVVLATLPGINAEAVEIILRHRGIAPLTSVDVFVGLLSPASRTTLLASYPEFVRTAVFAPPELVAVATGGVGGTPITASVTLTLVPVAGRLAVIRRETE